MAAAITTHIGNAVSSFCDGREAAKQLAIWDLHLAVEKTLKVFLLHKGVSPPNIHDLADLEVRAREWSLLTPLEDLVSALPTGRDAVKYRYGELPVPAVGTFYEWYETALEVIDHLVNQLARGFFADHASITIQALPWHPSRRKDH